MDGQIIYERNRSVYDSAAVAEIYAGSFVEMGLLKTEEVILSRLGDRIVGRAVLDIGVGGGRTVPHLHAIAGRYVGIDYAQEMISRCRQRFPDVEFHRADAIDLAVFAGDSFDVAWFSFNGIDYAVPADRVRIMEEIRRVLKPGGTFVFSSHNVRSKPWRPRLWARPEFDRNPWRMVGKNVAAWTRLMASLYHYRRNKPHEIHGEGFAVRVDQAHEYRLLTYHVALGYQVEQLEALGFDAIEAFGLDGSLLSGDDDPDDAWIYYVARKAGAMSEPD